MRYAAHLLPNALLLVALLRMTHVHLHADRRAIFGFLLAWLGYSLLLLFCAQVWPMNSPEYLTAFKLSTLFVWPLAGPALYVAGSRVVQSVAYSVATLAVLLLSCAGAWFALSNSAFAPAAKILVLNCFAAAVAGSVFLFASIHAEQPDKILWRCAGAFFVIHGYGYLLIGILRPRSWAYLAFVLAGAAAWFALAWFVGPRPEHLFTLEKLGIVWPMAVREEGAACCAPTVGDRNG